MSIGIIGAMEPEVSSIRDHMEGARIVRRAGMDFCVGTLDGTQAVVVRCGVGKVCAALCVQVLVDEFGVDAVVNTGVAGSLDARLNIGDVLVASDAMYHDVDATIFGYAPGEVPQLGRASFEADEALAQRIVRAATEQANTAQGGGFAVVRGRVVSGDVFVADPDTKARLSKEFAGACCEMEGAAVAQACWMNGVPFAVVRCISDKADGSDTMDYPVFETMAAARCADIVERMLRAS